MRILFPLYSFFIGLLGGVAVFSSICNHQTDHAGKAFFPDKIFQTQFQNSAYYKQSSNINLIFPLLAPVSAVDTGSYSIPVRRIGRLFVIEATIDDESGFLIFDTGATNLVLNRTYFRDHVRSGEIISAGITGNVSQVDRITANNMTIGELKFEKLTANLTDLGHIENRRGIKVLGLIGFDLIKSFEITFDVANNRILLNPVDKNGNLLDAGKQFNSDYIQNVEIVNNILFVKATIGEKLLRFCFDTGAETNALNSHLQKTVLQTVSITRTVKLGGAGFASREVIYGIMNEFNYGDSQIPGMETIITYMDHLYEAYGVHIDGVLGFDFISKANFCINFTKKQMGISYNRPVGQ